MRTWLPIAVASLATACATLPASQPLPVGQEAAHTVSQVAPGQWHVMVRVNYFAPETEAERLLRARAAELCPDTEAVVEGLHLVKQPHQASADVHCRTPKQAALDKLVGQLAAHAVQAPATNNAQSVVLPVVHSVPEQAMVKSGPGLIGRRPEPGYLPAFAQVASPHEEVAAAANPPQRPTQDEEGEVASGWIPATGEANGPHALTVAEENLAAPRVEKKAAPKPFWPMVGEAYRGLVAEAE